MNKYELVYNLKEHLDTYSQTYDDYIMSYGEVDMIYHYIEEKDKKIEILKSRLEEYQEYVEINHKEIERLNNIINKIEEHFVFLKMNSTGGNKEFMEDILDFIKALQELKGDDK